MAVTAALRPWLRAEGLAVLVASIVLYRHLGGGWGRFALLFLAPDLSFVGYLAGPRAGALAYNAVHSYVAPLALAVAGLALPSPPLVLLALIWTAHIGFDRLLGYGLKYPTAFQDTHLGPIGRHRGDRPPRAGGERRPGPDF